MSWNALKNPIYAFSVVAVMICASSSAQAARNENAATVSDRSAYAAAPLPQPAGFTVTDKKREIKFKNYSDLPASWQSHIDEKTYTNISPQTRAYLLDILGKMDATPAQNNDNTVPAPDEYTSRSITAGPKLLLANFNNNVGPGPAPLPANQTVIDYVGKVVSFENNKVLFETTKESSDAVAKNPELRAEPGIDSLMFHRVRNGIRLFNIKSKRQEGSKDNPPLHLIGIERDNKYFIEAHVDTHPNGRIHVMNEIIAGIAARHVPPFKFFIRQKWPNPFGIGQHLNEHSVDTNYSVSETRKPEKIREHKKSKPARPGGDDPIFVSNSNVPLAPAP